MFKDLKKGYQVHTLDVTDLPKYFLGTVINASEPRFQQPTPGQYQQLQDRVLDLTVEIGGQSFTYVVPENQSVAMANGITLACGVEPIMNQLNAMKKNSEDAINSIDKHRDTLVCCETILEDINPAFKQTKEQDRKIKSLEGKVDKIGESFDELKKLIVERFK